MSCVCVWHGVVYEVRGRLGLGFTNLMGTSGVLDVYVGCGLGSGRVRWCYVFVSLYYLCSWKV